jgi:hypothetical protein
MSRGEGGVIIGQVSLVMGPLALNRIANKLNVLHCITQPFSQVSGSGNSFFLQPLTCNLPPDIRPPCKPYFCTNRWKEREEIFIYSSPIHRIINGSEEELQGQRTIYPYCNKCQYQHLATDHELPMLFDISFPN